MVPSIYDLQDFYAASGGRTVRRAIAHHIETWWDSVRGLRVIGIGYAQPYLDSFLEEAERVICLAPAAQGSHPWPKSAPNLTALVEETELPLETNSVDRILLIHSLEYAELPGMNLQEIWRVLKSSGRLIVVVPNRRGLWSRAEWSPFGHGTPYSYDQLRNILRDQLFVHERSTSALYMPPTRSKLLRNIGEKLEHTLPYLLPGIGGVHIVEVSKQIYSGLLKPASNRIIIRTRPELAPTPRVGQ